MQREGVGGCGSGLEGASLLYEVVLTDEHQDSSHPDIYRLWQCTPPYPHTTYVHIYIHAYMLF